MLKELYRISLIAREALENFYFDHCEKYDTVSPDDLQGACGSASLLLCEVFAGFNFVQRVSTQEFYYPDNDFVGCHCWTRLNDRFFIDITCTQFGGPRVYISEKTPYEHSVLTLEAAFVTTYLPVPMVEVNDVREDLIKRGWPDNQLLEPIEISHLANCIVNDYYARFDRQLQSVA